MWEDFENFFAGYSSVQDHCWHMNYHRTGSTPRKTTEENAGNNHRDKKDPVMNGMSRSVLIHSGIQVVCSCQYGTRDDLPRIANGRIYQKLSAVSSNEKLWRIMCFFVNREFRRKGAARLARVETLNRIRAQSGRLVEAFPVTKNNAVPL